MNLSRIKLGAILGVIILLITAGFYVAGVDNDSNEQLHVDKVNSSNSNGTSIDYNNLTEDQKEIFREAIQDGSAPIPEEVDSEIWVKNRAVRYQDEIYEVAVAVE